MHPRTRCGIVATPRGWEPFSASTVGPAFFVLGSPGPKTFEFMHGATNPLDLLWLKLLLKELLLPSRPMASRSSGKPRCPCERPFRSQLSPDMLEVWAASEGQKWRGILKHKHILSFVSNVI